MAFLRETSIDVVFKIGPNIRKLGSRTKVQCSLKPALILLRLVCFNGDPPYLSSECDKLQQDLLDTSFEHNS